MCVRRLYSTVGTKYVVFDDGYALRGGPVGSIDGMMQGIYVKKGTTGSGAPPSNEMER